MEDSHDKEFINISNKKFKYKQYTNPEHTGMAYKPNEAFWCSLESSTPGFLSEYDYQYGEMLKPDENGNFYITTVKLKDDTAVITPNQCEKIMEGYSIFLDDRNDVGLNDNEKRCLFLEYVKDKQLVPHNVKHLICQIDTPDDIDALERAFGNYHFKSKNSDEVYENLYKNVRKGMRLCFAGVEVTDYLLGRLPICASEQWEIDQYKQAIDSKYHGDIGAWDMHSLALFDTKCINVIKEKVITKKEHDKEFTDKDKEENELDY